MLFKLKFLILVLIFAFAQANVLPNDPSDENKTTEIEDKPREKRQLTYIPVNTPIFYDAGQQQQQQQQQQQSGLLGLTQNIPIVGTLVSGLPVQNLLGGLPVNLGGLTSGLTGTLGNLGGNLGNLGQLVNLGGLLGGQAPGVTTAASCPVTQKLSCRCEPLVQTNPLQPVYPLLPGNKLAPRRGQNSGIIDILDQSMKGNKDGSIENIIHLSNGATLYLKTNKQAVPNVVDGFYALKISEGRFLTINFTMNDEDYTVNADVYTEPPKTTL